MSLVSIINKFRNLREYLRKGGIAKVERINVSQGELLKGRRVVITGGSSGIGLSIAKRFLDEGAMVVITGRSEKRLEDAKREINNDNLYTLVWDIDNTTIANIKILECEKILDGCIDIFVNNAGISRRQKPGHLTRDVWASVLSTNLTGNVFVAQYVCQKWKNANFRGVMLNIASNAGLEPVVDAYGVSKSSLIQLTRGWAKEYGQCGIRINAIAPGVIVGTNINTIQRSISPEDNLFSRWYPARRFGTPLEIAEIALFLVSDMSSYIYGQTIVADGGATL